MSAGLTAGGRTPRTWIFDFDGTLVDSVALIRESMRHATRTVLGVQPPDDVLMQGVGRPLVDQMRELDPDRAVDLVAVYRQHNLAHHADLLRPYLGVDAMLAGLRGRGLAVAIVTSKMRDALELGLEHVPLGAFDAIVTCEDTERHKPDPAPVAHCLALLGADPGDAVYVGDAPFDVRAGRSAGVATAAAMWGTAFAPAALRAERPDRELQTPQEALAW